MAEKSLPLPLSGTEVRLAIIDRIDAALSRDSFFHPHASYDFFTGHFSCEFRLHDAGMESVVKVTEKVSQGTDTGGGETTKHAIEFEQEPPNAVRVETGQPVPTDSGQRIKYARKVVEKA